MIEITNLVTWWKNRLFGENLCFTPDDQHARELRQVGGWKEIIERVKGLRERKKNIRRCWDVEVKIRVFSRTSETSPKIVNSKATWPANYRNQLMITIKNPPSLRKFANSHESVVTNKFSLFSSRSSPVSEHLHRLEPSLQLCWTLNRTKLNLFIQPQTQFRLITGELWTKLKLIKLRSYQG